VLVEPARSDNTHDHGKEPHRNTDAADQAYRYCAQTPKGLHRSYLKKEGRKSGLKRGYYRGINETHRKTRDLREH